MVTNDKTTFDITQRVFYEVAKLAWNGELEEKSPGSLFLCPIAKHSALLRDKAHTASQAQGGDSVRLAPLPIPSRALSPGFVPPCELSGMGLVAF